MASGVRIVSIPRRVTKKNEEYKLDGYHYVGMEEALRKGLYAERFSKPKQPVTRCSYNSG